MEQINSRKSVASKLVLQREFFDLNMKPEEKIEEYISRAEFLYSQLLDAGVNGIDESMVVSKIVTGLPKRFINFMSNWSNVELSNQTLEVLLPKLMAEDALICKFNKLTIGNALYGESSTAGKKKKKSNKNEKVAPKGDKKEFHINQIKCSNWQKIGHFKTDCPEAEKTNEKSRESKEDEPQAIIAEANRTSSNQVWLLDLDASHHMNNDGSHSVSFYKYPFPREIRYGRSNVGEAVGIGNILVQPTDSETKFLLKGVLFVPLLGRKLVSMGVLARRDFMGSISEHKVEFSRNDVNLFTATRRGTMWEMNFNEVTASALISTCDENLELWHQRVWKYAPKSSSCTLIPIYKT